jgi:hypothetical protein
MKLTTEKEFEIYTTEFKNMDVSLEQLFDAFKSHLIALTWNEETINQFLIELANELKDGYNNV